MKGALNKRFFECSLKLCSTPDSLMSAGRSFQRIGAATLKALLPKSALQRGTDNNSADDDDDHGERVAVYNCSSSDKYSED